MGGSLGLKEGERKESRYRTKQRPGGRKKQIHSVDVLYSSLWLKVLNPQAKTAEELVHSTQGIFLQ